MSDKMQCDCPCGCSAWDTTPVCQWCEIGLHQSTLNREQEIEATGRDDVTARLVCEACGAPYIPDTGQFIIFGSWFCNDCLD